MKHIKSTFALDRGRLDVGYPAESILASILFAVLSIALKSVRPIALTAFYSGMRRGEILVLGIKHVNLETRIIKLKPEDVKEGKFKRVPIHMDLIPILSDAMKVQALGDDRIFLVDTGVTHPNREQRHEQAACT
jgi:integrase